jgi:GntR family transcriptional regulator/MocR family aminotransferase
VARQLRLPAIAAAAYADPAGDPRLRASIARHVGVARSVRADAADVLVTHGAQQALDLIGRVLIEPGDCVAVEEPGYPPARALFTSLGARVAGVRVDAEGLDVAAIPRAAKLVYVTPSHQFPLGTPMSLQRRAALLAWAERRQAVIIEDDYDSEFRFEGRPLDPLQSLDRNGRVLYVGSFSKVMLPALRLGFLIAPESLQPALRRAKQLADWHTETPNQAALARFIDEGLLARHIRKVAREYTVRHEGVVAALDRSFRPWLKLIPSAAGLHVTARVLPGASIDIGQVVHHVAMSGVGVSALSRFCAHTSQAGLVIGYGAIPTAKVAEGLKRLAAVFRNPGQTAISTHD